MPPKEESHQVTKDLSTENVLDPASEHHEKTNTLLFLPLRHLFLSLAFPESFSMRAPV